MNTMDVQDLVIDKGPRRAQCRLELRKQFIQWLDASGDEQEIQFHINKYMELAKAAGREAANDRKNQKLKHTFMGNALALYLLASEPRARAWRLASRLYSRGVINRHQNTSLLALILKALGPYPHNGRRTIHRDTIVLEYLISQKCLPSDVMNYLATRGHGLDHTSRIAQVFFHPERGRKEQCIIEPKAGVLLVRLQSDQKAIALITQSEGRLVIKNCLIDPDKVHKTISYINSLHKKPAGD